MSDLDQSEIGKDRDGNQAASLAQPRYRLQLGGLVLCGVALVRHRQLLLNAVAVKKTP